MEWWHCLSHKDLIIKSIRTKNYQIIFNFDDYFKILNLFLAKNN